MKQRLDKNDIAPEFNVKDVQGKLVSLADYKSGYVLLAFMRYSGCPYCNLAIHRLTMEYKRLKAEKCEVVAFIQSHKQNIQSNIYERHAVTPQFPIVADPAMHVYEQYGVTTTAPSRILNLRTLPYWVESVRGHGFKQTSIDGNVFLVPAYFLVDAASKRVVRAHYGSSFYEHETFTKIYEPLIFNET